MSLAVHTVGGTAHVVLAGAIDSQEATEVRGGLASVVGAHSVVVDLANVTFIDSAGLGVLIGAIRRIRAAGNTIALAAPRPSIDRVLQLAGLDRIVDIHPTVEDAISTVGELQAS